MDRFLNHATLMDAVSKWRDRYNYHDDPTVCAGMDMIIEIIESLDSADVVPKDFHERCLQLEIRKRIASEQAVPKWIRVQDRLPEDVIDPASIAHVKSIKVLVAIKNKNGMTVRTQTRFKQNRYLGGKPLTEWKWRYSAGEVTHWMPLPEPPKEDTYE